jgi:two-component system, NtrC family, sensor kinase
VSERRPKILYVDDDAANLAAFRYSFGDRFDLVTATNADDALAIFAREPIGVLLSDQRMPGTTGAELCALVRERHPDVVRMIVTAYSDITAAVAAINNGQVSRYLLKPWREEALAEVLSAALEAYQLGVLTRDLQARLLRQEHQSTATYLLGRVLHELSTPASALFMNSQWMAATLPEVTRRLASVADTEASTLLRELVAAARESELTGGELVARINQFRQGEQPKPPGAKDGTDLRRVVEVAVAIVHPQLRARANLRVQQLPVPPVSADATQLSQIIVNLLTNAAESIAEGNPQSNHITLRVRSDERHAVIHVEDTGGGIPPDLLDRIFDPFVSTKSDDVKRGFGLAVVRDIINSLGGEIRVTSEVGKGSQFTVLLPHLGRERIGS